MVVKIFCDVCGKPIRYEVDDDIVGLVELGTLEVRIDLWGSHVIHQDHNYPHLCKKCYSTIDKAITSVILQIKGELDE